MRKDIDSPAITDRLIRAAHESNSSHGTPFSILAKNFRVGAHSLKREVTKYRIKNNLTGYLTSQDLRDKLKSGGWRQQRRFKI
jgi:hypothetical protein